MKGFKNPRIDSSAGGKAICVSGLVDITASAENAKLDLSEPANQTEVVEILVEFFQINSTFGKQVNAGKTNVSGTFNIYSQMCFPTGGVSSKTVQLLTHGLGCDRSYWDVAPDYSYVDYAAEQGYTTLFYDRLGVGLSDHPDPIQVVQFNLEISILHEFVQLLRTGGLAGLNFEHVVGVGHSFGSIMSHGLAAKYPHDFDALVLTGFTDSQPGAGIGFSSSDMTIASQVKPGQFSGLSNGYLLAANIFGVQFPFFRSPGFDQALLNIAEAKKDTVTIGEVIGSAMPMEQAADFTGPIDVVNGEHDLVDCGGNCVIPYNKGAVVKDKFFPAASSGSSWYIGEGSGHFINYHYVAHKAYEHIQDFIKKNGF